MAREPHIPLFLWIATAILVHLMGGGGADQASRYLEDRADLSRFAESVRKHFRLASEPVEVTLLDDGDIGADEPSPESEPEDPDTEPPLTPEEPDATEAEPPPAEPESPREPPVPEIEAKKKQEPSHVNPPQQLVIQRDRRVAVRQHVKDKNQKDNPNAEFIGDDANWVKEQTQARITSTDQDDPNPTPGGPHVGPIDEPGNSDESRIGQSDDAPGDPDRTPTPPAEQQPRVATLELQRQPQPAQPRVRPEPQPPAPRPPAPAEAQAGTDAVEAAADLLTAPGGKYAVSNRRAPQLAQKGRRARKKRLTPMRRDPLDLLGLGATGLTERGINLNLTPHAAHAAVGHDRLHKERQADGERRRTAHRGSWKTLGIERWRSAIENYVSSVKPGNQTALNTARVPFASYLNHIHNRIHPVFADTFLVSLDRLPSSDPMNRRDISTNVEIVLNPADGRLVRMGVTKTSGVTAFDIGALESVKRASPFGPSPPSIISPDGNVYFHWEFHRNPYYACSTYFARPYILKAKPKPAPPKVRPPPSRRPFDRKERPPPAQHGRVVPPASPDQGHAPGRQPHAALLCSAPRAWILG